MEGKGRLFIIKSTILNQYTTLVVWLLEKTLQVISHKI